MEIFPGGFGLSPSKEVNKGEIIIMSEVADGTSVSNAK